MTVSSSTFAISTPVRGTSVKQDVLDVARFFDLPPTGQLMVELTRTSSKTLDRAIKDDPVEYRAHLRVVADFVREARTYLFGVSSWDDWTDQDQIDMRAWLDNGQISLDGRVHSPHQVLADERLARRALGELLRVTQ